MAAWVVTTVIVVAAFFFVMIGLGWSVVKELRLSGSRPDTRIESAD